MKVRDRSGTWSEEETVAFQILPPLWQRTWFLTVVSFSGLVVAAGIAWLVTRWRLQRKLTELRIERALEAERSRIARDLHDQLGSGLTEIAFLGDSLRMDGGDIASEAAEVSVRARELTDRCRRAISCAASGSRSGRRRFEPARRRNMRARSTPRRND